MERGPLVAVADVDAVTTPRHRHRAVVRSADAAARRRESREREARWAALEETFRLASGSDLRPVILHTTERPEPDVAPGFDPEPLPCGCDYGCDDLNCDYDPDGPDVWCGITAPPCGVASCPSCHGRREPAVFRGLLRRIASPMRKGPTA